MKTIANKIFFGIVFIFLSWKGLDGLIINVLYNSKTTIDILDLEKKEEVSHRNLEILNGKVGDGLLYYESNSYSNVDLLYPLISQQQAERFNQLEPISIKVLVRLNDQPRTCLSNGKCIAADSTIIRGIVKVGLENLQYTDYQILESDLITIDEDVILIETNEETISWYWNLAMFLGGTVFAFAILKSFFRRASSIEEYWNKITEVDET